MIVDTSQIYFHKTFFKKSSKYCKVWSPKGLGCVISIFLLVTDYYSRKANCNYFKFRKKKVSTGGGEARMDIKTNCKYEII